jgi:RNA polymerase sigma factor (sigma-70 family)
LWLMDSSGATIAFNSLRCKWPPPMNDLSTTSLHELIVRFQAGDTSALDTLIRRTGERLDQFARRMLVRFPKVRAKEQTDDVLQSALIRLTRALRHETPKSVHDFFSLAAVQIRRELLDLARGHARRPTEPLAQDPPEPAEDSTELDRWTRLHEGVEQLPTALRDVFSYTFYHGWKQAEIAKVLGISDRQVRRLWVEACLRLKAAIGDLPAS